MKQPDGTLENFEWEVYFTHAAMVSVKSLREQTKEVNELESRLRSAKDELVRSTRDINERRRDVGFIRNKVDEAVALDDNKGVADLVRVTRAQWEKEFSVISWRVAGVVPGELGTIYEVSPEYIEIFEAEAKAEAENNEEE